MLVYVILTMQTVTVGFCPVKIILVLEEISSASRKQYFILPCFIYFLITLFFRAPRSTSAISIWLLAVKVHSAAGARAAVEEPALNL